MLINTPIWTNLLVSLSLKWVGGYKDELVYQKAKLIYLFGEITNQKGELT